MSIVDATWRATALIIPALALLCGCDRLGYRPHTPAVTAKLETNGGPVSARVERVWAPYRSSGGSFKVDVRIDNDTGELLRVAPEQIEVVMLGGEGETSGPALRLGRVEAASVVEGKEDLGPCEGSVFRVDLGRIPLDGGGPYALSLERAVAAAPGSITPLPLVRRDTPHLGYRPPPDFPFVIVGRVGGGLIRSGRYGFFVGGLDIFAGPQFGKFSVGGYLTLGAGSLGGEMRYRLDIGKTVAITPFVSYGYYHLVGIVGFFAGHGGRAGLEVDISTGDVSHFGWSRPGSRVGFFVHAGPTYLRALPSTALEAQGGLSFGFL